MSGTTKSLCDKLRAEFLAIMPTYGPPFGEWTIDFREQGEEYNPEAGQCVYSTKTVWISVAWIEDATFETARGILMHEVAHVLTEGSKHDCVWRTLCKDLGGTGEYHSLPCPRRWARKRLCCHEKCYQNNTPLRTELDHWDYTQYCKDLDVTICRKCRYPVVISDFKH